MIKMIVAVDMCNGIGKDDKLLAYIKEDLTYFAKVTKGNIVVMGRKTYETLPVKPLKYRENIILTKSDSVFEGATTMSSVEEVLKLAEKDERDVFICGGQEIYEQFMGLAEELHVTYIFATLEADRYFPAITNKWEIVSSRILINPMCEFAYSRTVYKRKEG